MDLNDKIARASLHVEVADRVRDMIFDRTLPPGHRIDELDLSAKLGTSRTPLREALKVLANEGLVRLAPGRGAYVTELSAQEVDSLFPVLAMLEGRCAAEAVRRQTATDVRKLNAIHQRMEDRLASGDAEGYHQATDDLHRLLQSVAGNPWLARATSDLRRFLRLARGMTTASDHRLLQSLAEHRTLMKTIARGDAESAEQVMHHHLLAQQKAWRVAHLNPQAARSQPAPAIDTRPERVEPAAVEPAAVESASVAQVPLPQAPAGPAPAGTTAPAADPNRRDEVESLGV